MTNEEADQMLKDYIKLKYKRLLPYLLSPEINNKKSGAYIICTTLAPEYFNTMSEY